MTLRREPDKPNSRLKDLIDIGILARDREFTAERLYVALDATFSARATHRVPDRLPAPAPGWDERYRADQRTPFVAGSPAGKALGGTLPWNTVSHLAQEVAAFLDPLFTRAVGPNAEWKDGEWRLP